MFSGGSVCRIDSMTPHPAHEARVLRFTVARAAARGDSNSSAVTPSDGAGAVRPLDGAFSIGMLAYESGIERTIAVIPRTANKQMEIAPIHIGKRTGRLKYILILISFGKSALSEVRADPIRHTLVQSCNGRPWTRQLGPLSYYLRTTDRIGLANDDRDEQADARRWPRGIIDRRRRVERLRVVGSAMTLMVAAIAVFIGVRRCHAESSHRRCDGNGHSDPADLRPEMSRLSYRDIHI